jgi:hypothetical protein
MIIRRVLTIYYALFSLLEVMAAAADLSFGQVDSAKQVLAFK